jgi:hypothetical protein
MEKIIAKAAMAKTAEIQSMLKALAADFSSEATIVTGALLDVLAARLGEDQFVAFCEELEAA